MVRKCQKGLTVKLPGDIFRSSAWVDDVQASLILSFMYPTYSYNDLVKVRSREMCIALRRGTWGYP